MRRALLSAALVTAAVLVMAVAGGAANLPGGTSIDVSITTPADGATVGQVPDHGRARRLAGPSPPTGRRR